MEQKAAKAVLLSKHSAKMRVLLINTSERIGGAAVAASRLMESLKNNGIKAKLLVRDKQTDQITVVSLSHNWRMVWKFVWERIVIWKANHFKRDNIYRRYCQYGYGHHLAPGISASGCNSSSLDKSGDVVSEKHREYPRIGQTRSVDHARHVAVHRYLPSCPRVYPLSAGVP